MKRNFSLMWRVAMALVMVLALGLVTATPAAATVSTPAVTVSPSTVSFSGQYTITFTTTSDLAASIPDDIRVVFPTGTTLPVTITNTDVTINSIAVASATVSAQLVTLEVAVDVPAGAVTVVFATAAAIQNPSTAGTTYTVDVSTSTEVTPVTSGTYAITAVPPTVPTVTDVNPPKANQGETLEVFIRGNDFTGVTAVSFGSLITVDSYTFVDDENISANITIDAAATTGTRDVIVSTAAGPGTGTLIYEVTAAGTPLVDVYSDTPSYANYVSTQSTIQAAITAAGTGDYLRVHVDTYIEDLTIPVGKDNLDLMPATGAAVTIKGVGIGPGPEFPYTVPNIDILASGVKIHGFTIESPDAVVDKYASGLLIGASNVEIYDNDFKVHTQDTGQYSVVIQTWRKVVVGFESVDISGLNIHDNTFDDLGDGAVGYDGIYVNRDTGTNTITIADNGFTGSLFRAITVERSNVVISGNSIVTDLAPYTGLAGLQGGYQGMFIGCFAVDSVYPAQSDVSVVGNTVKGATASEGFAQGIRVGHTLQTSLTNIVVSQNTVQDCDEGITVRADATGVTVNYNDIRGNTTGVQNDDTGVDLDAKYNWWGGIGGPGGEGMGGSDNVSTDADYDPWLTVAQATAVSDGIAYHGSTMPLEEGWNTLSVPLALSDSADTLSDIAALGDFLVLSGTDRNYDGGYYYDAVNTLWLPITGTYEFQPGAAVYIKMVAAADIPILFSGVFSLPSMSLPAGWNLVGSAFGIDKDSNTGEGDYGIAQPTGTGTPDDAEAYKTVAVALASLGTDASVVISPSMPGQFAAWAVTDGSENMIVGEGYWVFMTASATLAGFEVTPIYWIDLP